MLYMLDAHSGLAQASALDLSQNGVCHFGIPRQHTRLNYVSILMMGCPWGLVGVDILQTSTPNTPKLHQRGRRGPWDTPPVLRAEMRERSTERPESLPAPPTAPTSRETQQKPRYGTGTPGLCPDLSRPLTGDHHISPADKDQTEAQTPQPQKPRTSEQRNKAVSRGATWRRPDGLPQTFLSFF